MMKTGDTVKARVFFHTNKNYTVGTLEIRGNGYYEEYWVREDSGKWYHVLPEFIEEVK